MPLRKIYVCLLFILLSIPAAFSQIKPSDSQPLGYGIKFGINYSTIGTQYPDFYSGIGAGTLGMFFSKPINPRFTWFFEPAFSSVSFREEESENRHQGSYIDASGFVYFYPSSRNVDFAFIGGLRPSYLLSHKSEIFSGGNYLTKTLNTNKNENGQIDVGLMMGLSIALSPVINLEMIYNHSATNNNTTTEIKGRASTVEINLRLNALALRKSLDGRSQSTQEMVEYYNKGVALVMLTTPNPAVLKRLTKEGKTSEIEFLYAEMAERNAKVVDNFSRGFTFCPTYFFMDTSIYKVLSGSREGMFVNKNLQLDPTIKLSDSAHFFIASFCEDISNYTKRKHFGLFIYDDKMVQLEKPFNHPNQLAFPIYDYVRVSDPENKYRKATYNTVPYDKLLGKFLSRLYRNM